ncbi:hypothetical protein D3C77_303060 [compost metagenome]
MNCLAWHLQGRDRVLPRDITAEEQEKHQQGSGHADEIHRHHHRGIFAEAQLEVVGRDDVHQVGDDQRQARRVGDEAGGHDEGQRCGG